MSFRVNSKRFRSASCQLIHEISLSWQYALLLPFCVLLNSSPATSIGTPCDKKSVVSKFLFCLALSISISGFSVGPSSPQFHERLWFSPSWLFSLFASLCFSL